MRRISRFVAVGLAAGVASWPAVVAAQPQEVPVGVRVGDPEGGCGAYINEFWISRYPSVGFVVDGGADFSTCAEKLVD
ncbi:MAG: hypothetical protein M3285_02730 [Actinomycetota bacterium]|nr:hypothetical protein [Actinomycetota bacterium]